MSFYAVGDIHGEIKLLRKALHFFQARLKPADRVIFLGDSIDRGEDSQGCIDLLIEFAEHYPKTVFLRGNHEAFLLASLGKRANLEERFLWLSNGGVETLESYGLAAQEAYYGRIPADLIPERHMMFFRATRLEYKTRNLHFVHAGVLPAAMANDRPEREPRLWIREPFIESDEAFGRIVVFGHTPQMSGSPLVRANKVGIDTGAVFGGALSVARFGRKVSGEDGLPRFDLFQFSKA